MEEDKQPNQASQPTQSAQPEPNPNPPNPASPDKAKNSNKKVLVIVLVIAGVLIVLSIIGTILSGFFAKKMFEGGIEALTGGDVKIDSDSTKVTIKGDDGEELESTINSTKLADDYPKFVPEPYDSSKLTSSGSFKSGDTTLFNAHYEVKAPFDDVYRYYLDKLSSLDGFEVTMQSQQDKSAMIVSRNEKTGQRIHVTVSQDNDDNKATLYNLSVSEDKD